MGLSHAEGGRGPASGSGGQAWAGSGQGLDSVKVGSAAWRSWGSGLMFPQSPRAPGADPAGGTAGGCPRGPELHRDPRGQHFHLPLTLQQCHRA